MTRGKTIKLVVAAMAVGVLAVIVPFEITLRILYAERDKAIIQGIKVLYSPLYASIAVPNSAGLHRTEEFVVSLRANKEGFRDRDWDTNELLDIAFLGDSYLWGTGVEEQDRFTNIISEIIPQLKIGNFGLCTAGTLNELAIYRDFVARRRPKLVLLVFYPNDIQNNLWWVRDFSREDDLETAIERSIERRRQMPVSWPDGDKIVLRHWYSSALLYFVRDLWQKASQNIKTKMSRLRVARISVRGGTVELGEDIYSGNSNWSAAVNIGQKTVVSGESDLESVRKGWEITRAALHMLKSDIEQHGGQLVVVYLPYQERIYPDDWLVRKKTFNLIVPDEMMDFDKPRKMIYKIAKEEKLDVIDLTPYLESQTSGETRLYYQLDGHLTPAGHHAVSDALMTWLKKDQAPMMRAHSSM